MIVVSYGGGTNSTAMLIRMVEKKMPVDYIIFADTGGERPETYSYIKLFSDWLASQGYPSIIMLNYVTKNGDILTLEQDTLNHNALPPPCYGGKSCSQKFKISVVDKFIRSLPQAQEIWSNNKKVVKYVGYDYDELPRYENAQIYAFLDKKFENRYPLVDDWRMGRKECIEEIKSIGLPLPGKSSCFFCPNMKKAEIKELKEKHPDLFERALALERNGMKYTKIAKGLGRRWSWKSYGEYLDSDVMKNQIGMCMFFENDENGMPCGCYDG